MTETTTILILLTVHVDGKEAGGSMRKYARDLTKLESVVFLSGALIPI